LAAPHSKLEATLEMALRGSTAADDAFGEESLTCHLQQFSLLQKLCVRERY
jgi:hypothetical protein